MSWGNSLRSNLPPSFRLRLRIWSSLSSSDELLVLSCHSCQSKAPLCHREPQRFPGKQRCMLEILGLRTLAASPFIVIAAGIDLSLHPSVEAQNARLRYTHQVPHV